MCAPPDLSVPHTGPPNVDKAPLPQYSRKTTLRVKIVDRAANVLITVGGLGVIVAVLGLIAFIATQVIPLFAGGDSGPVTAPIQLAAGDTMVLHCDEYRRVGVRITADGTITSFAMATGETLSAEKPPQLGTARVTAAYLTLRPRTKRKVGSTLDVPHYHLLLGTSDGRVLVGEIAYLTEFIRKGVGDDPGELAALEMPTEQEFKEPHYAPRVLVQGDTVVEHVTSFGLYRVVRSVVTILRELDADLGGAPVTVLAGQINYAAAEDDRTCTMLAVTGDARTWLVREELAVNMMTDEVEASTDTRELTPELVHAPSYALVNELQDALVLLTARGDLYHFQRHAKTRQFVLPYPALNVFAPQSDSQFGRAWREIANDLREQQGHGAMPDEPRLTAAGFVLGDDSLVLGDNLGGLQSWLTIRDEDPDEGTVWKRFVRARALPSCEHPVISVSSSALTKAALVLDEGGNVHAINNTANRKFVSMQGPGVRHAVFNFKGDGVVGVTADGMLHHWWVHAPHSEISWDVLFGKVWYESYDEPKFEWQSTGGTDDVEPKLSLIPLIMGTIKGALYALLFAVPLAVLAAIYTSEFMHRNMRSVFKPTMEVMASLPSVVLGFLAALYFAPKIGPIMPTAMCALVIVPLVFIVFGWVWQRCPPSLVGKFGYWRSTALLFVLLAFGIWLASLVGPRAEVYLFPAAEGANPALLDPVSFQPVNEEAAGALAAGDFRTWPGGGQELQRDQEVGAAMLPKGWWVPGGHNLLVAVLALPCVLLLGWGSKTLARRLRDDRGRTPGDRLRERLEGPVHSGARALAVDIGISVVFGSVLLLAGFGLSYLISPLVEGLFFSYDHPTAGSVADFRRWITGSEGWKFEQSNSLVVGFAMGFAVIPLIYTISEDALSTVPNQLRAASLACGASRWQTTIRIVLPTAVSGIFSAIVIGLGRALGETMIVVMAAGGTPVMDMQPLNGFRSLSAAIAIEMPEAPHGGTLYRTLFLGGLVLFLMAFVINTMAEVVRMRLRRRLSRM